MAPNFLSVMWCREAFYGLGVEDVKSLILVGALYLPSVAATSQGDFRVTKVRLSASVA
jgi:hypothetical protein